MSDSELSSPETNDLFNRNNNNSAEPDEDSVSLASEELMKQLKIDAFSLHDISCGNSDSGVSTMSEEASVSGQPVEKRPSNGKEERIIPPVQIQNIKLPQHFLVKFIGKAPCTGLWGIQHTRRPVDELVSQAQKLPSLNELLTVELIISERGIHVFEKPKNAKEQSLKGNLIPLAKISYGVQDVRYTKVFACIVVRDLDTRNTCECYAFLSDSRPSARRLALSLSVAFDLYAKLLNITLPPRLAVDLRTPEDFENSRDDSDA